MGMQHEVKLSDDCPAWPEVSALLARHGAAVQMRMIDGQLAAPDDEPPTDWREIRVALAGEMISVRREPGRVLLVAWGNANLAQRQLWNALAWAFAKLGGAVVTPAGPVTAEAFAAQAEMPPGWTSTNPP
jgi:hypothetical protein